MALIPLSVRQAMAAGHTDIVQVALVTITHADLATPLRMSSDNAVRFSVDPLTYGTRSNGQDFVFVLMSAYIPDDAKDETVRTSIIFENVSYDVVKLLRAITSPLQVRFDTVFASAPDDLYSTFTGMEVTKATYDKDKVTLEIARDHFWLENWPRLRFIKAFFPALHGLSSS